MKDRTTEYIFKSIFCLTVIVGCSMNLGPVIDFSDAAFFFHGHRQRAGSIYAYGITEKKTLETIRPDWNQERSNVTNSEDPFF